MKSPPTPLIVAVFAILALFTPAVQAGSWYYQTIATDNTGESNVLWSTHPSPGQPRGGIELVAPSYGSAFGSRDIVLTNLRAFSCASSDNPERFMDASYQLSLTLLDVDSMTFGTVAITGLFNGSLSDEMAKIDNTFTGTRSYALQLGNNLYTVTIGQYTPIMPPSSGLLGSLTAHVSVATVAHAPEPSSLVLGGLGCAVLGLVSWRKRRRGEPATA